MMFGFLKKGQKSSWSSTGAKHPLTQLQIKKMPPQLFQGGIFMGTTNKDALQLSL